MALVLTGIMQGMRPVGNKADADIAAGEAWQFLSMHVNDMRYGEYDVQLADKDPQYKQFFDGKNLLQDWTGHKVKMTVRSVEPKTREIEREIKDPQTGNKVKIKEQVPVLRIRVTNLRDLGLSEDEE